MEGGKQYTSEEILEIEKSRAKSDTELIRKGAEIIVDEKGERSISLTNGQKDEARREMEYNTNGKEKAKKELINELTNHRMDNADRARKEWGISDEFINSPEVQRLAMESVIHLFKNNRLEDHDSRVENYIHDFKIPITEEIQELGIKKTLAEIASGRYWSNVQGTFGLYKLSEYAERHGKEKVLQELINLFDEVRDPLALCWEGREQYEYPDPKKSKEDVLFEIAEESINGAKDVLDLNSDQLNLYILKISDIFQRSSKSGRTIWSSKLYELTADKLKQKYHLS